MTCGHARLAAQPGELLAFAAVLCADDERTVGELWLVDALDGDLALQHRDVRHGPVLHVLVRRQADISPTVLKKIVYFKKFIKPLL